MKILFLILLLDVELIFFGQLKQVCFSFDDMPVVSYGITDSIYQKNLLNKIIVSLKTNNVPAIGFANEKKLHDKEKVIPNQVGLLKDWINNGLELGNHSFSHFDYNNVSFNEYTSDIIKGEFIIKKILNEKGKTIKYFRHPFLHVGNTRSKADSLSRFLNIHNYIEAPVTIDNEDYLFAVAYKNTRQKGDTALALKIGHDYIEYMEKKLKYYEMQSDKLFGRNINQILLLHASLINSDYLDSLIVLYRANNYVFISMDKTLEDTAYNTNITVFGNWGLSWIDKWALSMGKKGVFFKDDPTTPDYIKKFSE